MDIDLAKIDDAVLALLYLTLHDEMRAWKRMDWATLERLHATGLIYDPANKAKSVVFTEAGLLEAQRVFARDFTKPTHVLKSVRYGQSTATVQDESGVNGFLCRSAEDGGRRVDFHASRHRSLLNALRSMRESSAPFGTNIQIKGTSTEFGREPAGYSVERRARSLDSAS